MAPLFSCKLVYNVMARISEKKEHGLHAATRPSKPQIHHRGSGRMLVGTSTAAKY